ncbi:hypothetical protein [Variovorax sp. PAMC 28711]|uniref:hypothetical protein n=1 Tax=Variovorax sp. PAMC 28711 TaxID=1795631 RepID=UPI00078BC96C|nr:hypothetical protein [Variovorax sp. PAMC 28711]AMM23156.1 hypothetical protein AX767_01295 [Variovorax sp. PAMC 28711]
MSRVVPTDPAQFRRDVAAAAVPDDVEQNRIEVRLLTIFVTLSFMNDLIGPVMYILQIPASTLFKVAALGHYSWLVGGMFVVSILLTIPHFVSLLVLPRLLSCRTPRLMACGAAVISALTWIYLAVLAQPLDFAGPISVLYGRQSFESLFLALIYAVSLNAQQLREYAREMGLIR